MTTEERIKTLLWELCRTQDSITHLNETGQHGADLERQKVQRQAFIDRILTLVRELEDSLE